MSKTRVLLIDDVRLLAELEGTPVDRVDFEVLLVGADEDVVETAERLKPDVVVLADGEACPHAFDACRALRANPPTSRIPVIYVGIGLHRERYLAAGADILLPRPVTRLEMRQALVKVLGLRDRVAARRRVSLPVELAIGESLLRGTCVDISLSGAFVRTDNPPVAGEHGVMRFEAGGRELRLPVEVVRVGRGPGDERDGVGVRFVVGDAHVRAFLSRFVRAAARNTGAGAPAQGQNT